MEDSPDKYETPLHIDLDEARLKTLEQEFAIARTSEPGDLWYERNSGEILNVFVNGDRAWLMYRRNEEDAGFSTRNPAYTGPKNATLPYVLNNGQQDEFPVAWTISTDEAIHAVEHFLHTGAKASWLAWHDNSQEGTAKRTGNCCYNLIQTRGQRCS